MKKDTFSNRLQKAINLNNIKPVELANATGIDKSLISCYLSGKYKPGEENLSILAKKLDVSQAWLEGYDVPINEQSANIEFDELEILYSKTKKILTEDDKDMIRFVIEKRKREIDKQLEKD